MENMIIGDLDKYIRRAFVNASNEYLIEHQDDMISSEAMRKAQFDSGIEAICRLCAESWGWVPVDSGLPGEPVEVKTTTGWNGLAIHWGNGEWTDTSFDENPVIGVIEWRPFVRSLIGQDKVNQ